MKSRLTIFLLLALFTTSLGAQSLCDLAITKVKIDGGYKLTVGSATGDTISGLTWFNGSGDRSVIVQKNGEYCVKALFKSGCSDSDCIKITDLNSAPCASEITAVKLNGFALLCGVAKPFPKEVKWSTGDTSLCIKAEKAGTYIFYAKSANGCESKAIFIYNPDSTDCKVDIVRSVTTEFPPSICAVSNVDIKKIKWSTGDTTKCIKIGDAKEYCVTIVGTNGCEAKSCLPVQTECTLTIIKSLNPNNVANLCAISNQDVKSYKWSTNDTTKCITVLKSCQYCVTIVTKSGCERKTCFIYTAPSDLCKADIQRDSINGGIGLCVKSNQEIKTISWSSEETSKCIVPTKNGEYCVKIVTTSGCETKSCITYTHPNLSCKVEITKSLDANGKVMLSAVSGQDVDKYRWTTGDTTKSIIISKSGQYCVTILTKSGCETKACFTYTFPSDLCKADIKRDSVNGKIGLCATSNQEIKSVLWSTGETSKCIIPTKNGEYCAKIVTITGCEAKSCVVYTVPGSECKVEIAKSLDAAGKVTLCAIANQDVSKYKWLTGDTTKCITISKSGQYCVVILTKNGCETKACFTYTFPEDQCKVTIKRDSVNGLIELCASSTQPLNSITWSTGEKTKCIIPSKTGEYCVKIVTSAGCETKECIKVELPNPNNCKVNIIASKIETGYKLSALGSESNMSAIQWGNGQTSNCIEVGPIGVHCVKVQFANGCTASNCITIATPPTTNCKVEISKTITNGVTQFCAKVADSLKISKTLWSTGDTTACIKPTRTGEYCVVVYTTSGCITKYCVSYKSPNDTIIGNKPCNIAIVKTKRSGDIYLCALTTGSVNNASLLWSNGSKDKCQLIKKAGSYCVTIKTNFCEAKACYTIDSTEIKLSNNNDPKAQDKPVSNILNEEISTTKFGRFGPNPAMNLVNVEIESDLNQIGVLSITDAYGKIHSTRKIELFSGQNLMDIETMNLPKGLYHINLVTAAGRKTIKIVKE